MSNDTPIYLLRFPGGTEEHEFVLFEHYQELLAKINQQHEALWAKGPGGVMVLTEGGVRALEKAQAVSDELERITIERDHMRAVLTDIVNHGPIEDPGEFEYTGNPDDNRDYGIARTGWRLAQIARQGLTHSAGPKP
jgi:hypothetical protein